MYKYNENERSFVLRKRKIKSIIFVLIVVFIFCLIGCQKNEMNKTGEEENVSESTNSLISEESSSELTENGTSKDINSELIDNAVYEEKMLSQYAQILQEYYDMYVGNYTYGKDNIAYIGSRYERGFESENSIPVFSLCDINNDKIPELFIGIANGKENRILDMYAYKKKEGAYFVGANDSQMGFSLLKDGKIYEYEYSVGVYRTDSCYELDKNGAMVLVAEKEAMYREEEYYKRKGDEQIEISEQEYEAYGVSFGKAVVQPLSKKLTVQAIEDVKQGKIQVFDISDATENLTIVKSEEEKSDFIIENNVLQGYIGSDTKVIIPNGVTSIGEEVFCEYFNLEEVVIPNTVTNIEARAFTASGLKKVVIPESVVEIGDIVFYECTSLKEVVLSEGLKTIGNMAFVGCALEEVTIPNGVTSIGEEGFAYCHNLSKVIIPQSVTYIGDNAFRDSAENFIIYGKKDSYAHQYAKQNNIRFKEY